VRVCVCVCACIVGFVMCGCFDNCVSVLLFSVCFVSFVLCFCIVFFTYIYSYLLLV